MSVLTGQSSLPKGYSINQICSWQPIFMPRGSAHSIYTYVHAQINNRMKVTLNLMIDDQDEFLFCVYLVPEDINSFLLWFEGCKGRHYLLKQNAKLVRISTNFYLKSHEKDIEISNFKSYMNEIVVQNV